MGPRMSGVETNLSDIIHPWEPIIHHRNVKTASCEAAGDALYSNFDTYWWSQAPERIDMNTDTLKTIEPCVERPNHSIHLIINSEFDDLITGSLRAFLPQTSDTTSNAKTPGILDDVTNQRHEQIKRQLQNHEISIPRFKVWRTEDGLILVDGLHETYRAVEELQLPFEYEEYLFEDREQARTFLIHQILGYPRINTGQRILMALQLLPEYQRRAKDNQGRRTDLLSNSEKGYPSVNVNQQLATLAGVGKDKFLHFKKIWEDAQKTDGESVFEDAGRSRELLEKVLQDKITVFAAWAKYKDARKKKNDKIAFAREQRNTASVSTVSSTPIDINSDLREAESDVDLPPDVSQGFENQIFCGDNIEILKKLPPDIASLIITSPDYNLENIIYDGKQYQRPYAEYLEYLQQLWSECARILRDGGRLAINVASMTHQSDDDKNQAYSTPIFADIIHQIQELNVGLKYYTHIIWNKRFGFHGRLNTTFSARHPYIAQRHEFILIFNKNTFELEPQTPGAPSDLTADEASRWCGSVWDIVPQSSNSSGHPCPFPEELVKRLIKMLSYVGDCVVDTCNGSGSTTAAAAKLGRRWLGIDQSEKYCEYARNRTEKAYQESLKTIEVSATEKENPDDLEPQVQPQRGPDCAA